MAIMVLMLTACTSLPRNPEALAVSVKPSVPSLVVSPVTPQTPADPPFVGLAPRLDAQSLSFGWVTVPDWPERLGVEGRFWTENAAFWRGLSGDSRPNAHVIFPLQRLYEQQEAGLERFWAAASLERIYGAAGLSGPSQEWRQKASLLRASALLVLNQLWDLAFLHHQADAAKRLWQQNRPLLLPDVRDQQRAGLLRQALFLSTLDLKATGLDPYVSSLALDNDDLWISTWNGGLARVSLVTGQWLVLDQPRSVVAPIRLVRASRWFVYVFKELGFSRYSKVTGGWREFSYPPQWSGLRIQDVAIESDEVLWVAHLGQGLWSWNAGQWTQAGQDGSPLFINTVSLAPEGQLVGTQDRGLFRRTEGGWAPVPGGPDNVSAVAPDPAGGRWAVGSWGQGMWLLENSRWTHLAAKEFVTAVDWRSGQPWWGTVDQGLFYGQASPLRALGVKDGVPEAGVNALVTRAGRVYWGTNGQSVGIWSEDDDPMVYR